MSRQAAPDGPMQVGLVLPIAEMGDGVLSYPELRAYALRAEARGFDSLWVVDHLLFRFPEQPTRGIWECWSLLAALAEATERVTLGTLVTCTAFRNPALLAKMAAGVDDISGGRLILGLGAGWHQPELDAFGMPFDHPVARFEEALQIIAPLLREGQVDFSGRYYRAERCELRPAPARPGGPPILIGAFKPRTLRLAAEYADLWNTCWLGRPDLLPERRVALEAACTAAGRDPADLPVTVGLVVAGPGHGHTTIDPTRVLAGTAAEVADGLRAYQAQGVRHVICTLDPPTLEAIDWLSETLPVVRAAVP